MYYSTITSVLSLSNFQDIYLPISYKSPFKIMTAPILIPITKHYPLSKSSIYTQGSGGMLQLQPPPRLSFRLPLLFLMDNHMLLSKSSDSFVWKDKKSIKFWRSIFSSIFDSFFQANSLSNNFKYSKVDPKNDGKTCVLKRFCLFLFSDALLFAGGTLFQKGI